MVASQGFIDSSQGPVSAIASGPVGRQHFWACVYGKGNCSPCGHQEAKAGKHVRAPLNDLASSS